MTVYDVMDANIFNADERNKDKRLSVMITLEWASKIYENQKY